MLRYQMSKVILFFKKGNRVILIKEFGRKNFMIYQP